VAQVVEYWITVLKEGGSSPPGVFGDAAAEFAERKFTAVVENAAPGRAPRGVARHGTARYGPRGGGGAPRPKERMSPNSDINFCSSNPSFNN
jgi:hypothetical protein